MRWSAADPLDVAAGRLGPIVQVLVGTVILSSGEGGGSEKDGETKEVGAGMPGAFHLSSGS